MINAFRAAAFAALSFSCVATADDSGYATVTEMKTFSSIFNVYLSQPHACGGTDDRRYHLATDALPQHFSLLQSALETGLEVNVRYTCQAGYPVIDGVRARLAQKASTTIGAFKDTVDVTVEEISVWSANGDVLVRTSPRPSIEGLSCTNDYWLVVEKDLPGYQSILSVLLSAQAAGTKVTVSAQEDGGNQFCKLRRVIRRPA